jgi:hypothetical protein
MSTATTNEWHTDETKPGDVNYNVEMNITPVRSERDREFDPRTDEGAQKAAEAFLKMMDNDGVEEYALETAEAFYKKFKSACHGISRRNELDQLYNATYSSFGCDAMERAPFNRVLFAMARSMRVLRVIGGGTIEWTAFNRHDRDDRRPSFDDRHDRDDRRPRFDDRHDRNDRRPRFDDRHDRDDRRPRFDDRHDRDDRRPRFDDRR